MLAKMLVIESLPPPTLFFVSFFSFLSSNVEQIQGQPFSFMSFSPRKRQWGGKKAKVYGLLLFSEKYNRRAIKRRRKKETPDI